MAVDSQMTLALLKDLQLALCANNSDALKGWLSLGIQDLGEPAEPSQGMIGRLHGTSL